MKPTKKDIEREIEAIEEIQATSQCPVERRLAYVMMETMRWATMDTTGWAKPHSWIALDAKWVIEGMNEAVQ